MSGYRKILLLSANEPEELRPSDVYRVMEAARDHSCLYGFWRWLLKQKLREDTREVIKNYSVSAESRLAAASEPGNTPGYHVPVAPTPGAERVDPNER